MKRYKILLMLIVWAMTALPVWAQIETEDDDEEVIDTIPSRNLAISQDSTFVGFNTHTIRLMTRAYGDSIVLRWGVDDYSTWRQLNYYGYNVFRLSMQDAKLEIDTLALALKPLTLDQMRAKHPDERDTLAYLGMQLMYGRGRLTLDQTQSAPGTIGSLIEVHDEQQSIVGYAMLLAEWRRDLARDMALGLVDRNVKEGRIYQYVVQPAHLDSFNIINPGFVEAVLNEKFKPETFDVEVIGQPTSDIQLNLEWPSTKYSSFIIERRKDNETQWKRVNEKPFVPFTSQDQPDDAPIVFADYPGAPGIYHYRIRAYDAFGDVTLPCDELTVDFSDRIPPSAPILQRIFIHRTDTTGIVKQATLYFTKDSLEKDLIGYMPFYYNERIAEGKWIPLTKDLVSPQDTVVTVDVTGLESGMITIAAYDTLYNVNYSLPQTIRIDDRKAPAPPTNLRAHTAPDGTVVLVWTPSEDEDVDYYDVWFANDSTHEYSLRQNVYNDTIFIDSLSQEVNQRYIYYKVRATDFSTNMGEFSEVLQVLRPHYIPPMVCKLISNDVDEERIHMVWAASNEADLDYHRLFRKLEGEENWTLLAIFDADSVTAAGDTILYDDKPAYDRSGKRYLYAMETYNLSGCSSGLSKLYPFYFEGPNAVDAPIKLEGSYNKATGETRIAWELTKKPEDEGYYFCIYRKGPEDTKFEFLISAQPDQFSRNDFLLKAGETAEYYVQIHYEDGRDSQRSNIISVSAPEK